MLTTITLIMTGILIGVLVKVLGRFIRIPYTVMLFAIGIVLGLLSKSLLAGSAFANEGIRLISEMNPDIILYVFLPILVFDAAYEMDLHVFRKTLFNASVLAGPGVVICMLLTACLVMGMATLCGGYDASLWPFALMFGGLISATDPVAVVALLQELGTKKRFSTLVDGESLLNDGTGLVCFMMFYSVYAGQGEINHPFLYFVWVVIASSLIGFVFARLAIWLVERIAKEEVLQNCIMVAGAYLTFMLAQSTLGVSGVIALVVFGHIFAQSCRPHLKPETNAWMGKFWGLLAYAANTLIFLIVGVIIATHIDVTWAMIGGIVVMFIGLNVIRYIMVLVLMPILRRSGYGLNWREFVILGWGGLRGALGMCMALMVSCNPAIPQTIRHHVLIYTAGIVTLTLCVNATLSKTLVNKLRLSGEESASEKHIWRQILSLLHRHDTQTLTSLQEDPYLEQADWAVVKNKMIAIPQDMSADNLSANEMLCVVRRNVQAHMEMKANDFFHKGVLSYYSYERITSALAVLNDFEGDHPIDGGELNKDLSRRKWFRLRHQVIPNACNLCRGYVMILLETRQYIDTTLKEKVMDLPVEQQTVDLVRQEIDQLIGQASGLLDGYRKEYPEIFAAGVTDKAVRMLLASERGLVDQLLSEGVMSQDAADTLYADIAQRQGLEMVM